MLKKLVALFLGMHLLVSPAFTLAATIPGLYGNIKLPTSAATELPQVRTKPDGSQSAVEAAVSAPSGTSLNVIQSAPQAIIDWNKFNIGASAAVNFIQRNAQGVAQTNWVALNRIYDASPSQIYGSLHADGKVYLINQNGILFGKDSQINTHALIASTLNLRDNDFFNGTLKFTAENYQDRRYLPLTSALYNQGADHAAYDSAMLANLQLPQPSSTASVVNEGNIATTAGGSVYLLGPEVRNYGAISAPTGAIGLVSAKPRARTAGDGSDSYDLVLHDITDTDLLTGTQAVLTLNKGWSGGLVYNDALGKMLADSGLVGMYGKNVTQNGMVRAVTAVKKGGRIELLATDRISAGVGSVTASDISDAGATADKTFGRKSGSVVLSGLLIGTDANAARPAKEIAVAGTIEAPSGNVYLEASQRIMLGATSRIDVGGTWVDRAASDVIINPQMNTLNLRDEYQQKDGILQGATLFVDSRFGSSIGNISGYFGVKEQTAKEKSTTGGGIYLGAHTTSFTNNGVADDATTREIVVMPGAQLDFSGGGYRYAAGNISVTRLVSGGTSYDISSAPSNLKYDKIITSETNSPAFVQGSSAGSLTVEGRQVVLSGKLDGSATRGAYQNLAAEAVDKMGYQNTDGRMVPVGGTLTVGSVKKKDAVNAIYDDLITDSIEVSSRGATLPAGFGMSSDLPASLQGKTILSAESLNDAGLSTLSLYANQRIVLDKGAVLSLASAAGNKADGSKATATVNMKARLIDIGGSIDAPGGSVRIEGADNITSYDRISDGAPQPTFTSNPRYVSLPAERVFLEEGSSISVAGDRIDNTAAGVQGGRSATFGVTSGGSISLASNSVAGDGVFVAKGAAVDVSGGYLTDNAGKVTGADAGKLTLSGPAIVIGGDLKGLSLQGNSGGSVTFRTDNVLITDHDSGLPAGFRADAPLPAGLADGLVISGTRLSRSGFGQFEFDSYGNLTVAPGVTLAPSLVKLASPVGRLGETGTITATPDLAGATAITLNAGYKRDYIPILPVQTLWSYDYAAGLDTGAGSLVQTGPGGKITLAGPEVTVAGVVSAPAGAISVSALTNPNDPSYRPDAGSGTLTIASTGVLSAPGYNKPIYGTVAGRPQGYTPLSGGTITLSAGTPDLTAEVGRIVVEEGARIDISGSAAARNVTTSASGAPVSQLVAGAPGSVSISYRDTLDLPADALLAKADPLVAGQPGGSLTIARTSISGGLTVSAADASAYQKDGFDALTFKSNNSLIFAGNTRISVGRSLTLDAPDIIAKDGAVINLSAAQVTLTNSYFPYATAVPAPGTASANPAQAGEGKLTVSGAFLDVTGGVRLSGFSTVTLAAANDIRLSDRYYAAGAGQNPASQGLLETSGDLTLKATRIYPTSQSSFEILADNGRITVLPSGAAADPDVYSAFGKLVLQGALGIDVKGYLAAPMGSIDLEGMGHRVFLEKGSTVTTSTTAAVNVGSLDDSGNWTRSDNSVAGQSNPIPVEGEPAKSITVNGSEVIMAQGSKLDVSGGGSVYAYSFIPDLAGTVSPIARSGFNGFTGATVRSDRYVIVPDNSVKLPGAAVYLAGDAALGLKAGVYTLLPESYAFVPGALVISKTTTPMAANDHLTSREGYHVVAGYSTVMGTGIKSPTLTGYTVRSADDVRKEGHFEPKSIDAKSGGVITISGDSTILNGSINASGASLPGGVTGKGGTLALSGKAITVQSGDVANVPTLDFDTQLPENLQGTLQVSANSLNGKGLAELDLGSLTRTDSITVSGGSTLAIPKITLAAKGNIVLESGSKLEATGDGGSVSLNTALGGSRGGSVTVQHGAAVHATDTISLSADAITLDGDIGADHGNLNLASDKVYLVGDSYHPVESDSATSLYLSDVLWKKLSPCGNIAITSGSELVYKGGAGLVTAGALTIDAAGIEARSGVLNIKGSEVNLINSGKSAAASAPTRGQGTLNLEAAGTATVDVGNSDDSTRKWNLALDGFSTVNVKSAGDLTLKGNGTLRTAADLNLTSARIVTGSYSDPKTPYKASHVTIDAGGKVSIAHSDGEGGAGTTPGGFIEIRGKSIDDAGSIVMPSGEVKLAAAQGVTMRSGAEIVATGSATRSVDPKGSGYVIGSGGAVTLEAATGDLKLEAGSRIDVSAASVADAHGDGHLYGDAGSVTLSSPQGVASLKGEIKGEKGADLSDDRASRGGSFAVDAAWLGAVGSNDLNTVAGTITAGGFDDSVAVRVRRGDVNFSGSLAARSIAISADGQDGTAAWDAHSRSVAGTRTGNITITGTLDASGAQGGEIDLAARNDLNLASGSRLLAKGTGSNASGGTVTLKAGDAVVNPASGDPLAAYHSYGTLNLAAGALVDVSGTGKGGTVYLRAMRNDANDDVLVKYDSSFGLRGAAGVDLEAVKVYASSGNLDEFDMSRDGALYNDTRNFTGLSTVSANYQTVSDATHGYVDVLTGNLVYSTDPGRFASGGATRLSGLVGADGFRLLPGLEVRSSGAMTLNANPWDLSGWRAVPVDATSQEIGVKSAVGTGIQPGVITVRSGGDLTVLASIRDYAGDGQHATYYNRKNGVIDWTHPVSFATVSAGDLRSANAPASWGISLVAGADLNAGDPLALLPASAGRLVVGTVDSPVMVYTENAPLRFASAGDTVLTGAPSDSVVYGMLPVTLGSYRGAVSGRVGGNLILSGGVIQTATGDIDLKVNGRVELSSDGSGYGTIRTTGEAATTAQQEGGDPLLEYWNYRDGGNIRISAGGNVRGAYQAFNSWDASNQVSDAYIWSASYDASNAVQGIATMGGGSIEIKSGGDVASQIGTFGTGDLRVTAAGDLLGRYLVADGTGSLTAFGNVGNAPVFGTQKYSATFRQPTIELLHDSKVDAVAYGGVTVGEVLNPSLASSNGLNFGTWNPSYGPGAKIGLTALTGDVALLGEMYNRPSLSNSSALNARQILPASAEIAAAGDILIYANTLLAPGPTGGLRLFAGGDILGSYKPTVSPLNAGWITLQMSDMALYGSGGFYTATSDAPLFLYSDHGASSTDATKPLHYGDQDPVQIKAGTDIAGLKIITAKATEITAGGDIRDGAISMQNISPSDVSVVSAGGNLVLTRSPNTRDTGWTGIEQGGPGYLTLLAGDSMDLGNSQGIRSVGNAYNGYLGAKGSDLLLLVGGKESVTPSEMTGFFNGLRDAGSEYSDLLAQGKTAEAQEAIDKARAEVIEPMLKNFSATGGNLNMVESQISTNSDKDNIYIVAGGNIDVGRSTLKQGSGGATGIFTAKGGDINVFSVGDLNVNVSRVMTYFGGDITLWSDKGNVNAGRGSKTQVSAQPPKLVYDPLSRSYRLVFSPPAVGSGIRALTYDPNTTSGEGLPIPEPGDIYLFAPKGVIDAGEAGIAGGKLTLGATAVLNAKNISFSAGSVGVPSTSDAGVSLGALSGSGSVNENSKMIEQTTAAGSAHEKNVAQASAVDDFLSRWLDVKIISFDADSDDDNKRKGKE